MASPVTRTITIGTRPSRLARWQTNYIRRRLMQAWPEIDCQVIPLITEGDKVLDRPLPEIGGKGLFTQELEAALLGGEIDLAVHSLKDLPVEGNPDLLIGAIPERADARDVLVSSQGLSLDQLPVGAPLGTSSLRRQAQIAATRPDLRILPLRGNVDTRLRKVQQDEYAAIILAAAGLERLGFVGSITQYLSFKLMLPAPGQGALAVQCRIGDQQLLDMLESLHHEPTEAAVTAERTFLTGLGGGCSAPIAAYASRVENLIEMRGLVASVDGKQVIRVQGSAADPRILGKTLAMQALEKGAGEILV